MFHLNNDGLRHNKTTDFMLIFTHTQIQTSYCVRIETSSV